jgi:hypothetical protein
MADGAAPTAPGVLQPARPHLAAALACVTDATAVELAGIARRRVVVGTTCVDVDGARAFDLVITDPAEAWEALATRGVIPDAWAGDARRAFACTCEKGWRYDTYTGPKIGSLCHDCRGLTSVGPLAHPAGIAACVALASDTPGILAAEALAREIVARLATWNAPRPQATVWRVIDPKAWRQPRINSVGLACARVMDRSDLRERKGEVFYEQLGGGLLERDTAASQRAHDASYAIVWDEQGWPEANPFAPLVELFALGYALDSITDTDVTLVCPALGSGGG